MAVDDPQQVPDTAAVAPAAASDAGTAPGGATPAAADSGAPAASDASQQPSDAESDEDAASEGGVNLAKAYSRLNEKVIDLLDGLGIRRSATFPHIKGQSMADHIQTVDAKLQESGGLTKNFVSATHSVHGPNGGVTTAHPSDKMRNVIVPKDFEPAKDAINACKALVNKAASIMPAKEQHRDDSPTAVIDTAKNQLALIGKQQGAGMTAMDLAGALIAIPSPVIQTISRLHSSVKNNGHHPMLTAPAAAAPAEDASAAEAPAAAAAPAQG